MAAVVAYPLTDYVINDAIERSLPHVSTSSTDITDHFDQYFVVYSGPWKVEDVDVNLLLNDSDKNVLIYTRPVNITDAGTVVQDIILSNTVKPSSLSLIMEFINGTSNMSVNDLMTALLEGASQDTLTIADLSGTSEILIYQAVPYSTANATGNEIKEIGQIGAEFENITGQPPMFTIAYPEKTPEEESGNNGPMVVYTKPLEVPLLKLKMSIVIAAIFTLPLLFYMGGKEIYKHVNVKKYNLKEKIPFKSRWILLVAVIIFISFILGAIYSYFFMAPLFIQFLYISAAAAGAQATYSIYDFVSFIAMLTLIFGLIFEFPIVIFVLNRLGLVQKRMLTKYRKHVYVILFIIAAVITPPDVISQVIVAIPMIFFYEISILIVKLFGKKDPPLPAVVDDY
ncbi:twin-arginine translocase subunit TatC [Methanolapillus africanus]|uniref:twin-arginine translocase subunit TatC n=1 Tax=Methanolapillus africanus TaxID=3028297 RepID=UPI0030B8DC54